jgi:hypothetical protein
MALVAKNFWGNKRRSFKTKYNSRDIPRSNQNGPRCNGRRMKSCCNCSDKSHFVANCTFEKREDNEDRLAHKDKSKTSPPNKAYSKYSPNKNYDKKVSSNKKSRVLLMTREEYPYVDEEEETSKEE